MPRRSLYWSMIVKPTIAVGAKTNGTLLGTSVDTTDPAGGTDGFKSAMFVIHTGTITDGTHTVTCEESENDSDWTTVAAGELQGTVPAIVAADDNKVFEIGYMGGQRYLRLKIVSSGTTTGGVLGATVLLGNPGSRPVQR